MAGLSYAEARDFVTLGLGECQVSTEAMELNLLGILEDFKNRIGTDASKLATASLVTVASDGTYAVPAALDRVLSIENADGEELRRLQYPCPLCASDGAGEAPTSWHMEADVLVLHPTPTTVVTLNVRGTAARSHILYDVTADNVKVWRVIDLPTGLHYAYVDAVIAQCIMFEDPGRAAVFANSAAAKMANWKNDQTRSMGARRPIRYAGTRMNSYTWGTSGPRWSPQPVEDV